MKTENTIKIKDKLAKRVYKLSRDTQKDTSYHFNKALENYLDETDDLKEALKRLNNKKDKVISSKEFRSSLGI
jgi:predicted DNA-binding protein